MTHRHHIAVYEGSLKESARAVVHPEGASSQLQSQAKKRRYNSCSRDEYVLLGVRSLLISKTNGQAERLRFEFRLVEKASPST
jgi:hypothetical protein